MTTYPSTPIAYASYPYTGIIRTDRKFRATIQFYTGSAWGRGVWACSKTFSNEAHVDNFIAYMKRKKGWDVDEVWYGKNVEPKEMTIEQLQDIYGLEWVDYVEHVNTD